LQLTTIPPRRLRGQKGLRDDNIKDFPSKRCRKCGTPISEILRYDNGREYTYEGRNLESRYIDRWGFARDYCKDCMKRYGR